ncbi:MAG: HU family DNA-binding protein [Nevskia sp.]|nr:HU family DNA-binding protein [Nevskia sp.]
MSDAYTRKDLVQAIAKTHGLSKAKAESIVLDLFTNLSKALKKGQKLTLSPFGTFEVRKRPARKGRNPATGASIKIAAKKVVRFKAYAGLKNTIG